MIKNNNTILNEESNFLDDVFRAVASLIIMENNDPQLVILVMQLKTNGYVARQSPDSQTDVSFFFTSLRPVLIFLWPLLSSSLPFPSHVTRSRFLFSGVR